jgi:hypothetical protein
VRALAMRSDDFRELCDDDPELGQALLDALIDEIQLRRPHRRTGKIPMQNERISSDAYDETAPGRLARPGGEAGYEETLPGSSTFPRTKSDTDKGIKAADREPAMATEPTLPEPPPRLSSPRMHARGSTPPLSSLIADARDVEGDLDRALTDLTAEEPKQLAPADDEDAEIVVEPREHEPVAAAPAKKSPNVSEPEISIEQLEEDAAASEDSGRVVDQVLKDTSSQKITMTAPEPSDPEIVVVADSGPHQSRPKRQSDAPE